MLQASEAEQTAWIRSDVARGMPVVDPDASVLTMLILNRSEVTLPLIEQKIEEVLRSPYPSNCFTDKSVNPQKFVDFAAAVIMSAGNAQSLKEIAKLLKLDKKRFGYLVEGALIQARTYNNPFIVAYHGLEIGDPDLDSRILPWAVLQLDLVENRPPQRRPSSPGEEAGREFERQKMRTWWAESLVNKYGSVPSEEQWRSDPVVSRLKPTQADSVHDSMMRLASDVVEKRAQHPALPQP